MIAWPWRRAHSSGHASRAARPRRSPRSMPPPSATPGAREEFAALLADRAVFAVGVRRGQPPRPASSWCASSPTRPRSSPSPSARPAAAAAWPPADGRGAPPPPSRRRLPPASSKSIAATPPAVALYRSLGFDVAGERRNYYRSRIAAATAPRLSCGCNFANAKRARASGSSRP